MNQKPKYLAMIILLMAIAISSCQSPVVFQQHQSLPASQWEQDNSLIFQAVINDTTSLHELYLDVRNTINYPYRNLFIFLDIEFPEGIVVRDTIECILADRRGQWTGSGFGTIRSNRFLFRDQVWFPQQGTYIFTLHQAMRDQVLEGIADIGIRIERK
jgi:gliding motility-associated lipoprotein GldH